MASDDLDLAQSPAQAAEGDVRGAVMALFDVQNIRGAPARADAPSYKWGAQDGWDAAIREVLRIIDRRAALSAEGSATIAVARKQAAEEMRERAANTAELIGQSYESAWRQDRKADPYLQGCADTADEVATAIRALPSSSPEDQQKAAATPTIADPDGEARS